MTDKSFCQIVRLFPWSIGRHVGCRDLQRLTHTNVANFATIDYARLIDTDLMTKDGIVEILHLPHQSINLARAQSNQVVSQIIVALLCYFSRFLEQLRFSAQQPGLFISRIVVELFELLIIHFLFRDFAVGRGEFHLNLLLPLVSGPPAILLFRRTLGSLDIVINDREAAALVLEGISYRIKLLLDLNNLLIDLSSFRLDYFQGGFCFRIERLIFSA